MFASNSCVMSEESPMPHVLSQLEMFDWEKQSFKADMHSDSNAGVFTISF